MSYMKQALWNICWCCKGSSICGLIQHWFVPVDPYMHTYTCSQNYIFVRLLVWADFWKSPSTRALHSKLWDSQLLVDPQLFLLLWLVWIGCALSLYVISIWNIACSLPFHLISDEFLHFVLWLEESFKTFKITGCKIAAVYSKSVE